MRCWSGGHLVSPGISNVANGTSSALEEPTDISSCCGLNYTPPTQNPHIKAPVASVTTFGDWTLEKQSESDEVMRVGPSRWDQRPCKNGLQRALSLSLSQSPP